MTFVLGRPIQVSQGYNLNNTCNICGKFATETNSKRLVRDHDHTTGYIRGTLCDDCNVRIGIYESRKHDSKFIVKARKKKKYVRWLNLYNVRIILHLESNTGILYKRFK